MNDNIFFCLSGLRRLSVYRLLVYQRRPESRVHRSEIGKKIQKQFAQIHITVYSMGMMTLSICPCLYLCYSTTLYLYLGGSMCLQVAAALITTPRNFGCHAGDRRSLALANGYYKSKVIVPCITFPQIIFRLSNNIT